MKRYAFKQVDVFTREPFRGNPVAVVLGAHDLDAAQMQSIAAWTNLSETTFVQPATTPEADYRLRIFTPRAELPFAGHPTLGSAHAVLEAGVARARDGMLRQECGAGLIEIRVEDGPTRLWLRAPGTRQRAIDAAALDALDAALGTSVARDPAPLVIEVGPQWLVAQVASADALAALRPDLARVASLSERLDITGVTLFGLAADGVSALHVRAFAPAHGVPEDPVCGSGNISVGAFLAARDRLGVTGSTYQARQGMQLGRDGRVAVRVTDGGKHIDLGGNAVTCVDGSLAV